MVYSVCVRGPLLGLWSTKSAVLVQRIKPMIHRLEQHSVSAACRYPQTDKKTVSVCVCICGSVQECIRACVSMYIYLDVFIFVYI